MTGILETLSLALWLLGICFRREDPETAFEPDRAPLRSLLDLRSLWRGRWRRLDGENMGASFALEKSHKQRDTLIGILL